MCQWVGTKRGQLSTMGTDRIRVERAAGVANRGATRSDTVLVLAVCNHTH